MAEDEVRDEVRRDFFLDDRGSILRVTFHRLEDVVVISVWDGDRCISDFQLAGRDASRFASLLLSAAVDHTVRP